MVRKGLISPYLRFLGVFRTQDPQSLAIGLLRRVVLVTEYIRTIHE